MSKKITVETIAIACHEANHALCVGIGDHTQRLWRAAEQWQRDSAVKGVEFRLANPTATAQAQHEAWCHDKEAAGWKYGEVKDAYVKTHPCLVPYDQLPPEQKAKDALFVAIVDALKPLL